MEQNNQDRYKMVIGESHVTTDDAFVAADVKAILDKHFDENNNVEVYKRCFNAIDLTTLNSTDTVSSVTKFVTRVNDFETEYPELPNVAAICVYPNFAMVVSGALEVSGVQKAVVAGSFPSSQTFLEIKTTEAALAVADGATEVDIVFNLGLYYDGQYEELADEISEIKHSVRDAHLKVILETGALKTALDIRNAAILSMYSGADFIKTSTGKVYPASPAADSSSVPEESNVTHLAVPADTVPLPIPADDLGNSTLQIPLEKLRTELELELDYGSVVFVTDPTLTSDVYATFQFDNFPHTPLQRTSDEYGHTTLDFEMPDNWQVSPDAPEALLTVTLPADALTRLTLDLEVGDVHLDDLQLQSLKVELDNGSLYADDLTVTRDLEADISIGGCLIRQLSGTKQANISAYRSIHLCLDGDPADYTIDARTDNVVRIGSKKYDKRYTSTGPKGDLDLSATGLIDLTPQHSPA